MELVKPAFGLIFWMSLTFLIVMFLLKKFAWKPILKMISDRENSIAEALNSAEKAREEMAKLKSSNEKILNEAKAERDQLLKEARELKESMITEAKTLAKQEGEKMLTAARENIQNEKNAAVAEIRNQVASLSIDIAEKILKKEFADAEKQKMVNSDLMKEIKLN
jgi:F-type H+-transporting ATPase subunit b